MVGGDEALFETHRPLLQSFGKNVYHMGGLGMGSVAKLINNMIAFCNMAAGAEGMMLGAIAGIDPAKLAQVIQNSSGDSHTFRNLATRALQGNFAASFALDLAYKDMHLALELADQLNVPVLLAPEVHNLMRMARGQGLGKSDTSAMIRVYEKALDKEVRG